MKHIVTEHKLNSGAKGLFVDVPGSGVVNILIRFNSGFQFGDFSHYEIPHVLEHMMGRGSQQYPAPNEFKAEIEKNGAVSNANTSDRYNGYYITCAAFELERMLGMMEEYIAAPVFPEAAFPTEISNVREELTRNTTEHGSVCTMNLLEKTYPKQDLGYQQRIDQLGDITLEDVKRYYQTTHTAKNARFYLSGEVGNNQELILRRLDEMFSKLPAGERLAADFSPGHGLTAPIVAHRDIRQLYYHMNIYNQGVDERMEFALGSLGSVLYGGWKSRVYGEARRRGLAYHIGGSAAGDVFSSVYAIGGYVTAEHAADLMQLVADQTKAVVAGDLKSEELEATKEMRIGRRAIAHQTAAALGNYYIGYYDTEDKIRPYEGELELIRAVSVADVIEAAKFILSSDQWGISWLGDLDEVAAEAYTAPLRKMFL